jgi:hypothetical protein
LCFDAVLIVTQGDIADLGRQPQGVSGVAEALAQEAKRLDVALRIVACLYVDSQLGLLDEPARRIVSEADSCATVFRAKDPAYGVVALNITNYLNNFHYCNEKLQ